MPVYNIIMNGHSIVKLKVSYTHFAFLNSYVRTNVFSSPMSLVDIYQSLSIEARVNLNRMVKSSQVFITRLNTKTTSAHVDLRVRKETCLTERTQKLGMRYVFYSTFYIKGNQRCLDELLGADLWPKGSMLKPFYG